MVHYVKEKVLTPDMCEGHSDDRLVKVLPYRAYYQVHRSLRNGVGSQRWFYRMTKKHPDWQPDDYIRAIGV